MRKFAAPAILFLLCASFYWRLTLTSQYTFLDSPDLANLDLPRLQFQTSAWRHSQLPLWDPNHWAGQPFLGQVTGAAYPANWLLGAFPFREGKLSVTVKRPGDIAQLAVNPRGNRRLGKARANASG